MQNTQETDKEAEVAEALFDLANMFEKAETVLEGEEVGASSKRSLRARGKHSQAGGASHRAAAGQHNHDEAPQANGRGSGYGRYRRDAESTAARPSQAAAAEANGGAVPQQQQVPAGYDGNGGGLRNGEALPRDVANPWDPRHLQSLGLLPGGKANGLLGLSGFPPQLPAGLAGFYPPPSPATAAAQLAAWPSTSHLGVCDVCHSLDRSLSTPMQPTAMIGSPTWLFRHSQHTPPYRGQFAPWRGDDCELLYFAGIAN